MAKDKLEELLEKYYEVDQEYKQLKKKKDPLNNHIKEIMREEGMDKVKYGDLVAKYSIRERTKIQEEKLLEVLKEEGMEEYIIVKEKPDVESLEQAVLSNEIDVRILADCVESKEIEYLRVKKEK